MVQVLLVLIMVFGLCRGSRAETLAPLVEGLDSGVMLMVITGRAEKVGEKTAIIPSEITTRDRYTIVYVMYSVDQQIWLRSAVKAVKQHQRVVIKIKIDGLVSDKLYYYRSIAMGEIGLSEGNTHVFLTK